MTTVPLHALPLRSDTLPRLDPSVDVPRYDRARLRPGVVHMSVGYFHRSHQAVYFDALARSGASDEWGIVGVAHRRGDMHQGLAAQDNLYTVVEKSAGEDRARVIGAMTRYLYAPRERDAVVEAMADPRTRLVTLTVTGAGYHVDPMTGEFRADDPEIAADLADPRRPRTAVGTLVEALDRRRRRGLPPFTVLSCDNLAANGMVAGVAVLSFARARDARLARWIEAGAAFPSSMVDRITPTTTDEDRAFVARRFGVVDSWPVMTESFSQWIVEDAFCCGRPPLEDVGVQFVADVRPYALMKTRLLNATHCALGHLGSMAGHTSTDGAMSDPVFAGYVERLMRDDMHPLLPRVAGIDLARYEQALVERLANPGVPDQLSRLARAGSTKVPRHLVTAIVDARAMDRPHPWLTLAVAGWIRYLRGFDDRGLSFEVEDPAAERLQRLARQGGADPRPLLAETAVFGTLGSDPGFAEELGEVLSAMETGGVRATLEAALKAGERLAA